jgi:hypothetical protein
MKISPKLMGLMYLVIGFLFTYLAIRNGEIGLWKFSTISLMIVATFDFGIALRILFFHQPVKK